MKKEINDNDESTIFMIFVVVLCKSSNNNMGTGADIEHF